MNIETLRSYCLSKKNVTEGFPFDNDTLVFKVMGKAFLLISIKEPVCFNVKCDPEYAAELREQYPEVKPAYHMNKKHWNTVFINGSVHERNLLKWIDDSYNLVIKGLSKKDRSLLNIK